LYTYCKKNKNKHRTDNEIDRSFFGASMYIGPIGMGRALPGSKNSGNFADVLYERPPKDAKMMLILPAARKSMRVSSQMGKSAFTSSTYCII
jgi:hypothetical protein